LGTAVKNTSASEEAEAALIALGYKQAESQKMVMTVMPRLTPEASVEEVVRRALLR